MATTQLGRCHHLGVRFTNSGVRASAAAPDMRRVLGVGPNASQRDVKMAYRRLALQFHPDVCKGEKRDVRFLELNRAYESLMDLLGSGAQTPSREVHSSYYENSSNYSYYPPQRSSSTRSEEDDPWADFLQSLVNGTYEDSNTGNSSSASSASSSLEENW